MKLVRRAMLAATALGAGCGGPVKPPPAEVLGFPSDTLTAEWAQLPLGAWISGDRWVVVSPDWDVAAIADFKTRTITPLGFLKEKAYLHPFAAFTIGDTVYLADWGKRRTTVWSGDGRLLDSIPAPDRLKGSFLRARDAAGQLYFEVKPEPGPDGSGNRDSAAVVRAPAGLTRFDTVARLAPIDLRAMTRENSTRFERQVFGGEDRWGVWPDGTIWIARVARNNLVEIDSQGRVTKGPALPDPVFEVTQHDRDRYLQGFPDEIRPKETDLPFAVVFPPFVNAFATKGDLIWLEKSKPVMDSVRSIQVLDRAGKLLRLLRLPGQARVIAVSPGVLLLAEQFERGVRLMQVAVPVPLTPVPVP